MSTFSDFQNAIQQRNEFVEDQLRLGSPVVAVACAEGALLVTVRGNQRKCFDVYDRIAMGALGRHADIESVRIAAIDSAHREGFQRSEADVCLQRLVGFGLSPAVKRIYNDQRSVPLVLRAVFAEVDRTPSTDRFFLLDYDGEFTRADGMAVAAGTDAAAAAALAVLRDRDTDRLGDALSASLNAWAEAWAHPRKQRPRTVSGSEDDTEEPDASLADTASTLRQALADGMVVEAVLLERDTAKEARFRSVDPTVLESAVAPYRTA